MEFIKEAPGAPKPVGAYSAAVKANGFVFLAGQIALDPETGTMAEGGVEAGNGIYYLRMKSFS